jgi:hypothetical protein
MEENKDLIKQNISLNVYSSFIFLTNVGLAYYYNYYVYSLLFLGLFTTSVIYHYYQTILSNIIDKVSILLVVGYGYNIFINKCFNNTLLVEYTLGHYICILLVGITFLSTIYLYCYGYICNQYCFCENLTTQELYHTLLHLMASLGHHIIMIM